MNHRILLIFIIYTLSNALMVLNFDGVYWDDWTLLAKNGDSWKRIFYETQTWPLSIPVIAFAQAIGNGILPYRIFTFISFFVVNILFLKILDRFIENKRLVLLITLISSSLPINQARSLLICSFYTSGILIYTIFIYFYTKEVKSKFLMLFSFVALMLSFINNAIIFFHISVMGVLFFIKHSSFSVSAIKLFIKKNYLVLSAPFAFYIFKMIYLNPYGAYKDYNIITLLKLLNGIPLSINGIILTVRNIINSFDVDIIFLFSILGVTHYLLKFINFDFHVSKRSYLLLGLIMLFGSIYPFAVVEKLPYKYFVDTRFDSLTFYGMSFILVSVIFYLSEKLKLEGSRLLYTIIISLFIAGSISNYSHQLKFWYQNEGIKLKFSQSKIVKNNTSFIVELVLDSGAKPNYMSRNFYSISAIANSAFGNTSTRLFSLQNRIDGKPFPNGEVPVLYKERIHYGLSNYIDKPFQYRLTLIQKKRIPISTVFMYLFSKMFNYKTDEQIKVLGKHFYLDESKL